jgi:hypothetical protein
MIWNRSGIYDAEIWGKNRNSCAEYYEGKAEEWDGRGKLLYLDSHEP